MGGYSVEEENNATARVLGVHDSSGEKGHGRPTKGHSWRGPRGKALSAIAARQ